MLRPSPTAEDSLGELPEEDTGSSRDRRRSLQFSSSRLQKSQKIDSVRYKHDHVSVLTRQYNSVLPKVVPFCLCNMALTYVLYYLRE
jgi:hypothetical protein